MGDRAGYAPLERSLALALEHKLEDHAARAYRTLQFYAALIHDFARAEQAFRDGVEYCEERGIFSHSAYIRAYYTMCELERGNWTEATRMTSELLQSSEVTGMTQRVTLMTTLALVRIRRGDPGADEILDEALALAMRTGETSRIAVVACARAEQAWYAGKPDDVAREAALGLAHVHGHTTPWLNGELLFWRSRAQTADQAMAGQIAQPYELMLAGDWQAAAAAWERIGMPYEQALALAEGPEESQRDALVILDRLGAGPLAAIVRRQLRDLGARVPRGPNEATRTNASGLTTKEVEVLQLLVQGRTSAQIARRLHRSPRTVDHHVSAILQKLDVHTRSEAVAAAFALGMVSTAGAAPRSPDSQ